MIIYLHIPKTGGTSVNEIFKRAFGSQFVHVPMLADGRVALSPQETQTLVEQHATAKAMGGHPLRFPMPPVPNLTYEYVTVLRDPIERLVSFYFYERRIYQADPKHRSKLKLMDFIEALKPYDYGKSQCRWLDASQDAERAKDVLRQFAAVGTTENFNGWLMLMRAKLGLPLTALIQPRLNTTKHKPAREYFDAVTWPQVEEMLATDIAVYTFAQELFQQELAKQGARFAFEMRVLETANRLAEPYARLQALARGKAQGAKRRLAKLTKRQPPVRVDL